MVQRLGELVELQLADLESLAARLELLSLSREAGLLLGKSLLPQRQGLFPARHRNLPVEHLPEIGSVGLLVGLEFRPNTGSMGSFGLHARLQVGVPVAEALALAL